jgi:hypothetical protein
MLASFHLLVMFVVNPFRSQRRVEIENLFLRHQLNIALRSVPHHLRLRASDRTLLILMTWLWPSLIGLLSTENLISSHSVRETANLAQ